MMGLISLDSPFQGHGLHLKKILQSPNPRQIPKLKGNVQLDGRGYKIGINR